MYPKEITQYIVTCWGKGLTAEETVQALDQYKGVKVGLATVYRHRHNLTAQHLIDELLKQQQRDIAGASSEKTKLHFRNELLKLLLPQRIEQLSYHREDVNINNTENIQLQNYSEEDKIAILDAYRRLNKANGSSPKPDSLH